ncbi:MAG TPA: formylglycine-generating enzyme family protein [Spirochaetota bacterium]|nr:formylglycine-generating enzyme family protein [Spirochaetota bacterium]
MPFISRTHIVVLCSLAVFFAAVFSCKTPQTPEQMTAQRLMTVQKSGEAFTVGGIEFVSIKEGQFAMGSPAGIGKKSEQPQHNVGVSTFWMSSRQITQKQYRELMGNDPVVENSRKLGNSYPIGDTYPVFLVNWDKAKAFCDKFSEKYKVIARLPYEAEWEYACRGGTGTLYHWGDDEAAADTYAWHLGNSGKKIQPVGTKGPNPYGLYDMCGNVEDWCMDWYGENYYNTSPAKDPRGPESGKSRVVRGGSYLYHPKALRSSNRGYSYPFIWSNATIGFRVVIEVPKAQEKKQ